MCANNQFFLDLRQDEGRDWVCANVSIIDYRLAPYLTDLHKLTEEITGGFRTNIFSAYLSISFCFVLVAIFVFEDSSSIRERQ